MVLKISKGFFYSKNEEFSIVFKFCIDVNPNKNHSEMSFKNFNSLTFLQIIFNKKFVGIWESNLIAVDSFMQTSIVTFYFNVLKWPQKYWLYWNSPNLTDCIEWIQGFIVDSSTGEWRMSELLFDKWVIISFVIIVLIITITSDIDLNASYALLENITFYWMLFSIFNVKEYSIKNYFNQISVVITHFNSLIFPLFGLLSNTLVNNKFK